MRRAVIIGSVLVLAVMLWTACYRVAAFTYAVAAELERAGALAELTPPPQTTIVFDRHGRPAFSFYVEQRINVTLDQVSPVMIDALLAVEDRRFFSHRGLDPVRIAAAARNNVLAGRIVEGGSTLTQQLARAAQLSPRRTFERKLREAMIAARLEQRYSKREILEAYLNTVYFGEGYYGVEAAARGYFGKPASDLDASEAALLAALVRSPSHDAPCVSPERAVKRRNLVLRLMRQQGRIGEAEYARASAAPVVDVAHRGSDPVRFTSADGVGKYFQEELRRQLVAQFGNERVLRGGLRVYSTYDPELQKAAEAAVAARIAQITRATRRAQDLQGSLVSMDPSTGDVYALVGGRDFDASSFNRATQARRQAGSAFKPILFAAALERGYGPGTLLTGLDVPIGHGRDAWLPGGEHEAAQYTLRRALKVSSNRAAAQLLQQVGTTTTAYYAQRLGITSPLPLVPSLALGTGEVTLLELTAAYTAFANRGSASAPRLFTRVEDSHGVAIFYQEVRHTRALSEGTAYMMSSMLADVISGGSAARVRAGGFTLPAAGKTGTSDDYADAWFIGYTPRLVTGVWFGLDRRATIMARGFAGTVAVPAWTAFMKVATRDHRPEWFRMPADIEKVKVCSGSGARATEWCTRPHVGQPDTIVMAGGYMTADYVTPVAPLPPPPPPAVVYEELYSVGTVSSEACPLHAPRSDWSGTTEAEPVASSPTPMVDEALQRATRGTGVQRVVGYDGVVRLVAKQRN
ncbi:MAG TPA: PBP1A family penicillin-binding protein [Vicinamibacterales bacterium]|nr:PBP1A family penicillin-binding protein [Vicinamibacterales bacterium]